MANKDAPFGFIPVRMLGGAYFSGGQDEFDILSTYGTNIFSGDVVEIETDGTIKIVHQALVTEISLAYLMDVSTLTLTENQLTLDTGPLVQLLLTQRHS